MLSFLGLCNYYRKLIPHLADISAPLYAVTQETKLEMNSDLMNVLNALKSAMCPVAALRIPDPEQPFILETDASIVALGAVLRQGDPGESFPVAFFSIGLTNHDRNYSTYERELLAVVKSCEFFRVFLLGAPFTLRTDHAALAAIFTSKLKTSSPIVKWVMRLQELSLVVQYMQGKENVVADALSYSLAHASNGK